MSEINVEALIKENEAIMKIMDKVEEKAKDEIVKYFDRMHDKLFAFQLILLAGYIAVVLIPSVGGSPWLLILPILCVARMIHLDWRMMEHNRVLADVKNRNKRQIDKLNEKQMWTNLQSIEILLESIAMSALFIYVLLL